MAANPMTQFEVYRIGPEIKIGAFDISFTNASLFMVVSSLAILIIFNIGSKKILSYQVKFSFWLSLVILLYQK